MYESYWLIWPEVGNEKKGQSTPDESDGGDFPTFHDQVRPTEYMRHQRNVDSPLQCCCLVLIIWSCCRCSLGWHQFATIKMAPPSAMTPPPTDTNVNTTSGLTKQSSAHVKLLQEKVRGGFAPFPVSCSSGSATVIHVLNGTNAGGA